MKPKFKVGDEVRLRDVPSVLLLHDDKPGDILRVTFVGIAGGTIQEYYAKRDDEPDGANLYFEDELESAQEYHNEQAMKKLLGVK